MTLTITLPDEAAGQFQCAAHTRGLDLPAFAVASIDEASDTRENDRPAPGDLMAFAGVGYGRPGVISSDGTDVDAYIRTMHDEWNAADALPWDAFVAVLTDGLDAPGRQPLSDYAVSREAIYEDHP